MSNSEKVEEKKEAEEKGIDERLAEEESEEEDDCPEEGIHMKFLKSPKLPTQKEVDEHNVTHWPYRDWCFVKNTRYSPAITTFFSLIIKKSFSPILEYLISAASLRDCCLIHS